MADAADLHRDLVDSLVRRGAITDSRVEAAFRAIPRHLFLPEFSVAEVYRDEAIPTKLLDGEAISSSSQPEIMATMLQQLELEPGSRVLEVGAGTGYNAALMSHLVGADGLVVTVDLDDDLVVGARAHLAAAGASRVRVVLGDGGRGCPEHAPYDRIILTVGAWDIAPAWSAQLRPGGRLVLPLAVGGSQKSVAFVHAGEQFVSASVKDCVFMRLRGAFAGPDTRLTLATGLRLYVRDPAALDAAGASAVVHDAIADLPTGVRVSLREIARGLVLWIALREPGFCWLEAIGPGADEQPVPRLYVVPGKYRSAPGVFESTAAAFLTREPGADASAEAGAFEVHVRGVGGAQIAERLRAHVQAWDAAGRPGSEGLRIRAMPIDRAYTPAANEHVVEKRWTRFVLDWDRARAVTSTSP